MRAILATKWRTVSPRVLAVLEGIPTPVPLPLCYARNFRIFFIIGSQNGILQIRAALFMGFSRIPPLNIISGPDLRSIFQLDIKFV
ncbi:hypothetical protein AVEN_24491-1 [Araneus ventricosus]|uniref:Uncharacterized protein n=1 Tax=Araneus ventricosus TaxID=182803 RepID=A0A4Y2NT46_ARAVE|nr:hypothetical protein AVEN_24491-1 [Araneus ventricosus]